MKLYILCLETNTVDSYYYFRLMFHRNEFIIDSIAFGRSDKNLLNQIKKSQLVGIDYRKHTTRSGLFSNACSMYFIVNQNTVDSIYTTYLIDFAPISIKDIFIKNEKDKVVFLLKETKYDTHNEARISIFGTNTGQMIKFYYKLFPQNVLAAVFEKCFGLELIKGKK